MPMMKKDPVIFVFNAPLASGCDYVMQTIRHISPRHPAYGIALGDIVSLYKWFTLEDRWIVRRTHGALVLRPISLLPGVGHRWVRLATYLLYALLLRCYVDFRHRSDKKILWFFEPFHVPPLFWMFQGYTTLYDCVDYYPGFSKSAKSEHTYCMRASRFVFANSAPLALQLKKQRSDVRVVPLGFAPELFASFPIASIPPNKKPFTVGFIGSISDRIDFPLLYTAMGKLPSIQFMFVGPLERNVFGKADHTEDKLRALLRYPNMTWVPEVPKRTIPSILRHIDAGTIPYRNDLTFNRYSFPMKVLEYFAAGLPVVTGDIASLYPYAERGLLTVAHSASEYIRAIQTYQLLGWPRNRQRLQVQQARKQSWRKKIQSILTHVL